ncbi:MAG: 3-hydroxybutyryl-CoA dehydrogenase, partial [Phycisphaerales bacterium]|nr:3-hydroxybutyryl-CoA dehydrogenase [Phycisphaerales bacterium]
MHEVSTIGVIGAGQMGGGIAQVAASTGFETIVFDARSDALEACRTSHASRLARLVEKEKMTSDDMTRALGRLRYVESLDALAGVDIAIEAIVEDASIKKDVFSTLASMLTGNQILASNTSSISITELATSVGDAAGRFIGMHFFNPVPIMKLVEVINGLATDATTTARTIALAEAMGKTPLPANDRAGFVSNRVLMPMINEAFYAWM